MENFSKNLSFPFKFILIHLFLYFVSYGIALVNYFIIVPLKYKTFFISYFTIISLELIFMIKLVCLFKASYDSTDNIKCILIIYTIMSFISAIFVSVEYVLIFKNIKDPTCKLEMRYKIPIICISLLYYAYNNLIFIFECYIVLKGLKQCIMDRIQSQSNGRNNVNNERVATQSSEKTKKYESFVKEDTIYIIHGNLNNKSSSINNVEVININNNICDSKDKINENNDKNKKNKNGNKEFNTCSKGKEDKKDYQDEETKSNEVIITKTKLAQKK